MQHPLHSILRHQLILVILLIGLSITLNAQNLNGIKITVSPESITALKFNSKIMDYQWSDPSGYTCIARDYDNTLQIKTLNNNPKPTTLIVSEGKRTHYFIIDFIAKVNINETKLYYDYSDLKQLKKLAQATASASPPIAQNTTPQAPEKEQLSAKERKQLEKEKAKAEEKQQQEALQKKKQEEAERARLAAEKQQQIALLKQQEAEAEQKKKAAEAEQQRIAEEKQQQALKEKQRKEQERADALAKEQAKIEAAKEQQRQIAAAKEAERKRKAEEEAARIQKLNDEKAAAAAAAKEKQRLAAERQKELAEQKEQAKQEQIRQQQLAALKEQQRKEEEKQKQLAKLAEEKRQKEEAERLKKEAEANKTSYTHTELWKKYPNIVFGDPPPNQHLTGEYYMPADTTENSRVSYRLLDMDYWLNITSNTENGVTMTMQSMIFSGVNSYIRILIKNESDKDFLAGVMNLKWMKSNGDRVDLYPGFVTEFPVVLPHKTKTFVFVSRAVNAAKTDKFVFSLADRLEKTFLELSFSGVEYNIEMSR
ncbi:MAG TPA: hypothetical protein PLQ78_01140 [Flavipsychrobacter sp.]|jgi:hypothetical protein|nr:hypothetical protein [Flavipsychrobacter sp.]